MVGKTGGGGQKVTKNAVENAIIFGKNLRLCKISQLTEKTTYLTIQHVSTAFVYKYCKQDDQLACISFKTISFLANSK